MRSPIFLWIFLFAIVLFSNSTVRVEAQLPNAHSQDVNPPMTDPDEAHARIIHDMEKKAAKERLATLKSDTDKLLKLSVELKAYVDRSNENVLSLDVVRKADEIDKLARSIKEKMKGPN